MAQGSAGERHEPLPSLTALPGWLWRRAGPLGRAGTVVVLVGIAVALVVFLPKGAHITSQNEARDRRAADAAQAARVRATRAEQRPRHDRVAPAARPALLLPPLEARIRADSAARPGRLSPVRRVECNLLNRPTPHSGRYDCTAVTAEVIAPDGGRGVTGYPYRALVDAHSGALAWCKIAGQAGEGSYTRQAATPIPATCGG